ncbi:nuclear hormone receptor HR96 [Chironomus tepperi]|uniref:nuclear hormone receptor HR96 n=1 Tax=Chironomus tepperi TaxID=113505 RepID=UPI00391F9D81
MSKQSCEKICVVCGDRSLGFNFNVLSCESCKAFFRRNAISNKKFSCPFSNVCEITVITRRFCQKCRLEKCFKVGMKKEYIMSDEDKEIKRIKIEQNRNKRKLKADPVDDKMNKKIKEEKSPAPSIATNNSDDSDDQSISSNQNIIKLSSESSVSDIVSAITEIPKESSRIIQQVMTTQDEALSVMSRIINDSNQALLLISHLIKNPSDGMLIISKMMSQSPLDALSVFTQFMSSPLDALQIIFKIMSSPKEVLKFMTELAKAPQNAMDIMRQFMSSPSPSESLQNMSRLITNSGTNTRYTENETIKSMLDVSSLDSPKSIISMPSPCTQINSPSSSYNDSDSNNNDYQQLTTAILKEIAYDISGKKSQAYKVNSIDSIINEAIKLEYNTPEMITNYGNTCRELNEVEAMKIQELLDANCALYAPIEEDHLLFLGLGENLSMKPETSFVDPILLKVINLTAVAIRRLIKMSKKISGFKKMCQEDQIALLKGGCTEMMILRSVMQYDSDNALWKIPSMNRTNLKADILKLCPKGNVYEEHENFIKTFDVRLRTDERVVLILCAITLFCPDRANIIHNDVIKLEQNSYYFLLRRYLESIYEGCEARSIFLQLLKKLQEVRRLNEEVISVYLDVNPSQVEPLLREIFDLKV